MLSRTFRSASSSALIRAWAIVCLAVAAAVWSVPAAQANSKYAGIVVDAKTGRVLYSNSANERRYPASLTKIMTLYILFEELEAGRMNLDTPLKASAHSAGMAPSKVGIRPGETIKVRDAIGALVTKSANDVAATIAENVEGSEPAFARRMTRTAHQLGMRGTQFRNASGLPNNSQYTTAADMALLGRAIQERFPTYYKYFSMRVFSYKGRRYGNHNRLLGRVRGVDGIKTGYIRAAGFNLVTSVRDNGRHVVAVVMGGRTGRSRDAQMKKLIAEYLPKASRGPNVDDVIVAVKAPLPTRKPEEDAPLAPIPVAAAAAKPAPVKETPVVVAAVPLPPAPVGDTDNRIPDDTDDLVPGAIAEGDADPESSIETASILPTPKAINVQIAEAHAMAVAADLAVEKPARAPQPQMAKLTPPAKAVQPARPDGWHVQIAAVPSKADALALLAEAQDKAGKALRGRDAYTEEVDSGGTKLYRARFVGFDTQAAAVAACKSLKRVKYGCYATQ